MITVKIHSELFYGHGDKDNYDRIETREYENTDEANRKLKEEFDKVESEWLDLNGSVTIDEHPGYYMYYGSILNFEEPYRIFEIVEINGIRVRPPSTKFSIKFENDDDDDDI